ncbi:hypothetical protein L1987_20439 [Smallanthus sonchifolius]|uniref:Uncharacterized protein n=1 Tax=Smallanthus sonchifolius TaxID=185202 RepID=A0ACB9IRU5_9ASTR|nr:hypothetical protein L1987_20439 [Smallanthus sonchifolius]
MVGEVIGEAMLMETHPIATLVVGKIIVLDGIMVGIHGRTMVVMFLVQEVENGQIQSLHGNLPILQSDNEKVGSGSSGLLVPSPSASMGTRPTMTNSLTEAPRFNQPHFTTWGSDQGNAGNQAQGRAFVLAANES